MDLVFGLLDSPYVLVGLGVLVAFVLYQKFAPNAKIRLPGVGLTQDELLERLLGSRYREAKLQRAVTRQKNLGHHLAAGRILEDVGRDQEAVDVYVAGQEFHAAATVLERIGRLERAAELYLQGGDYKKAAQMFADAGKPARAAELYLERKNTIEAARLFGLAQMWERAAELYLKGGYPLRAGEAYEKQGAFLRAAECYEKHFDENVTYATTYSSTAQSADHKSALMAGRLYERAGEPQRAYQVYAKGSYFKEAAAACMQVGQFARAAELYLRAEDAQRAADAWEKAGDPVRAANLRGEVAVKADRVPEAAAFFQQGQDYLRAAELYESVGMLAEAAGAYEAGDSHAAAGGVYLRGGLKDRAARAYEHAGEHETAAKLYEEVGDTRKAMELFARAGMTFKSGEAAARAGERERAIGLLQRVTPGDEHYRAASELLASLFIDTGRPALAVERLQRTLGQEPVSSATIDLYYWLAAAHDAAGHSVDALTLYKQILSEDLRYRDVAARAARLQGSPGPAPAAAPAASARPAAPEAAPPPPVPVAPRPAATPRPTGARFRLLQQVGRGPLGELHHGEDTTAGREVALRVLAPELLAAPGALQALVADLKAASALSHAGVARVLGLVDIEGRRAVVHEWIAGRSLAEPLTKGQRLPFPQALALARLLYEALAAVHAKGLVHGAVQPSNVRLAAGSVKLVDFGLGRLRQRFAGAYRAPEAKFDAAGDLYATAAVVYHALAGASPVGPQPGTPPPAGTRATGVPAAFDGLLSRALDPRCEPRPATAEECLAVLHTIGASR